MLLCFPYNIFSEEIDISADNIKKEDIEELKLGYEKTVKSKEVWTFKHPNPVKKELFQITCVEYEWPNPNSRPAIEVDCQGYYRIINYEDLNKPKKTPWSRLRADIFEIYNYELTIGKAPSFLVFKVRNKKEKKLRLRETLPDGTKVMEEEKNQ